MIDTDDERLTDLKKAIFNTVSHGIFGLIAAAILYFLWLIVKDIYLWLAQFAPFFLELGQFIFLQIMPLIIVSGVIMMLLVATFEWWNRNESFTTVLYQVWTTVPDDD